MQAAAAGQQQQDGQAASWQAKLYWYLLLLYFLVNLLLFVSLSPFSTAAFLLSDSLSSTFSRKPNVTASSNKQPKFADNTFNPDAFCSLTAQVGRFFNVSVLEQVKKQHRSPLTEQHSVQVCTSLFYKV